MIKVRNLTKRYKNNTVVDDLTFDVNTGMVTGFLGPNGAGKSTTMRMILGLDEPTSGTARINGRKYTSLSSPLNEVGALLDASAVHPKRSAKNHLEALCLANGISLSRVNHCLGMVGLQEVADKKVGEFSLGMRQRLGLAGSLLGDPEYLILDEPVNGLDPEGIRWVRDFLLALSREGRGVFVSSHQLGELSKMSDRLVVIGNGKMISNDTTDNFISSNSSSSVVMNTSDNNKFASVLKNNGISFTSDSSGKIVVSDYPQEKLGHLALSEGVAIYAMSAEFGLEDAFLKATTSSAQHVTGGVNINNEMRG